MSDEPVTYGDIIAPLATQAVRDMLNDHAVDAMRYLLIGTPKHPITRWRRIKRRWSLFRWWLARKLHNLAYWIEP